MMRSFPINYSPAPRVPNVNAAGGLVGEPIERVNVLPKARVQVVTARGAATGDSDDLLPHSLRRVLGNVLRQSKKWGDAMVVRDEIAEDLTYDPDSSIGPLDKPESEEVQGPQHPKERRLKEQIDEQAPQPKEVIELQKEEEFPESLPSKHPKEKMLERELEQRQQPGVEGQTKADARKAAATASRAFKKVHSKFLDQVENILEDFKSDLDDDTADKGIDNGYVKLMKALEDGFEDLIDKYAKAAFKKRSSQVRQAAGDITVKDVEVVSDQFPSDDNDPDAAADVAVTLSIKGKTLAQLLGKQERVLETALKQLKERQALKLLGQGGRNKAIGELYKAIRKPIDRAINQEAQDAFSRGARIDWRSFGPTDDEQHWSATIDPRKGEITYEVEFGVHWKWT